MAQTRNRVNKFWKSSVFDGCNALCSETTIYNQVTYDRLHNSLYIKFIETTGS